ncbi:MAG: two-component sensor histidine kinase, partial [Cyanobacteria bacterium]|nr:two-component sensor histidine kinase [Cyanobacteria bacterium GSL.Bin21]
EEILDIKLFTEEVYAKITTLAQRNWQLEQIGQGKFKGDRQRLTQAIINLAQNAVQHTQETDSIILGSKIDCDTVSFWIQDTGEGFASEDRELIFQRFTRAANNRRYSQGQGLGLSIVQAIIEAHHGKVEASSDLGKGAKFTIILPLD